MPQECAHGNQLKVRLLTYTPYGPLVGCLTCGTSWIARTAAEKPVPSTSSAS
jgi:hypothetical protein